MGQVKEALNKIGDSNPNHNEGGEADNKYFQDLRDWREKYSYKITGTADGKPGDIQCNDGVNKFDIKYNPDTFDNIKFMYNGKTMLGGIHQITLESTNGYSTSEMNKSNIITFKGIVHLPEKINTMVDISFLKDDTGKFALTFQPRIRQYGIDDEFGN